MRSSKFWTSSWHFDCSILQIHIRWVSKVLYKVTYGRVETMSFRGIFNIIFSKILKTNLRMMSIKLTAALNIAQSLKEGLWFWVEQLHVNFIYLFRRRRRRCCCYLNFQVFPFSMVAIWMNNQSYEFLWHAFGPRWFACVKKRSIHKDNLLPQISVVLMTWKAYVAGGSPKDFCTQMLWSPMSTSSYGMKTWVLATSILSSELHSFFNYSSCIHDCYYATNGLYILT